MTDRRILVLDNAIFPQAYTPFDHWRKFVPGDVPMVRVTCDQPLPEIDGFTHLIVSGSEASITNPDPWVAPQMEYARRAAERGVAVLGSCHGHQLLAEAFGGEAGRAVEAEMGWIEIEADDDAIFAGAGRPVWAFVSHFDEVKKLPPGFVNVARSPRCAIHAFHHETLPVWGVQAHPEIDIPCGEQILLDFAKLDPRIGEVEIDRPPRDSGWIDPLVQAFLSLR